MSRIGNYPIVMPAGSSYKIEGQTIIVKGPKGELQQTIGDGVILKEDEGQLVVNRLSDSKENRAQHGLYRTLINNMFEGVTGGFKKELELVGVGYKAEVQGQILELNLGYSHNIFVQLPKEIKASAEVKKGENPKVVLESFDKQLLGQVAAKIRSFRKPEPFKGKGVKFVGEQLRRKAGKAAKK